MIMWQARVKPFVCLLGGHQIASWMYIWYVPFLMTKTVSAVWCYFAGVKSKARKSARQAGQIHLFHLLTLPSLLHTCQETAPPPSHLVQPELTLFLAGGSVELMTVCVRAAVFCVEADSELRLYHRALSKHQGGPWRWPQASPTLWDNPLPPQVRANVPKCLQPLLWHCQALLSFKAKWPLFYSLWRLCPTIWRALGQRL